MSRYTVQIDKQLSANTVEATCKHEAISYLLHRLGYATMCIMPIVERVEDMSLHERHIQYYAYMHSGAMLVECNEVTE